MDNWNSNHENEYTGMTAQRRNRRRSEPANGQIEGQIGMRLDPVVSDEEDRIEELAETAFQGEPPTTASGGNFVGGFLNRNE